MESKEHPGYPKTFGGIGPWNFQHRIDEEQNKSLFYFNDRLLFSANRDDESELSKFKDIHRKIRRTVGEGHKDFLRQIQQRLGPRAREKLGLDEVI